MSPLPRSPPFFSIAKKYTKSEQFLRFVSSNEIPNYVHYNLELKTKAVKVAGESRTSAESHEPALPRYFLLCKQLLLY